MVRRIILSSDKYYYTYLDDVFQGLGDSVKEYNWLIADYECNYYPNDYFQKNRHNYIWLSSKEISNLILGNEIQFIWGVLLAFKKNVKKEDVLMYSLPSSHIDVSDGKQMFQNPLTELEIISCDSRELCIISKKDSHINNFLLKFPEGKEL